MANEHYEEEGHEEGEYHFSDDQINYDMEMDASAKDSAATATASPREAITRKLSQHRRMVIGLVVFIILLGIVYKLVAPSSAPVTDFQPGVTAQQGNLPARAPVKKAVVPPPAAIAQPQPTEASFAGQTTVTTTTQPAPVVPQQPAVVAPAQPAAPTAVATTVTTTVPAGAQPVSNITERIGTLEQQNTAMMSLIQTQYAQKIADAELQNTQLRAQVQELNARISNMEVAFRQLTKMLRNAGPAASAPVNRGIVSVPAAARVVQPRNTFTVQAIIPGRAWLKSDSGDTVTVAEGDTLKGYGRITRIDPYDGVVDIDTGNKVISLSYGMTGD